MPTAPLHPCPAPRCPNLIQGSGYCDQHGGERKAWRSVSAPPPVRLRGRANQARRLRVFTRNPLCVPCEALGRVTLATIADHIIPLAEGGRDDESNLRGICAECHKVKTQAEAARGARRRW